MVKDGVWSFDADTGKFTLAEPYASQLAEIKIAASEAFNNTIYERLASLSPYTVDQLRESWHNRVWEEGLTPVEKVDEFIIEALTGDL